jgi:hypothetical protein
MLCLDDDFFYLKDRQTRGVRLTYAVKTFLNIRSGMDFSFGY